MRSRWAGLAVLVLPVFLVSMDVSVLFLAIPKLSDSLQPSATEQLWILDIYGFLIAGLLITMGNLGDRLGRRRLLLLGATLFGVASVVAAFAPDPAVLIGARALMGVGGATLMPSSLSLISNMFTNARERGTAIGIWTAAFAGGMAVGPVIGGFLLHHYWWGSVFLINVPVLVILLALGPFILPEFRSGTKAPFDILGVLLSLAAIFPLVYAVKHVAAEGADATFWATAAFGAVAMAVFIRHELRVEHPLLDLSMFRNVAFSSAITAALVGMMATSAVAYLAGIYLQTVLGKDVLMAAYLGLPAAMVIAILCMQSAPLTRLIGVRWTFVTALAVAALGTGLMVFVGTSQGVGIYIAASVIAGIGDGILYALVSEVAVTSVPAERAGAATGISETSFELGTALGLALLGSLATVVFRQGGPGFSDTLGETVDHAKTLDPAAATTLIAAAKDAFVSGVHVASGTAAALLAVMAVVCAFALRPKATEPAAAEPVECAVAAS
jgi:DHA2 family multidrug resistance protein-like MFS transporter